MCREDVALMTMLDWEAFLLLDEEPRLVYIDMGRTAVPWLTSWRDQIAKDAGRYKTYKMFPG